MKILGIETSCDETAISLLNISGGIDCSVDVLGEALLSQVALHAQYGGVYPNLAKREHARNLVPILQEVLRKADMVNGGGERTNEETVKHIKTILSREHELFLLLSQFLRDISKPDIDCIAVTVGPGLEPALWVGINFARALHEAWHIPIVAVNHMEGHIMMALEETTDSPTSYKLRATSFSVPALALLVSGGHTELVLMPEFMKYELLGQTRDDAAGEAFDKCARLLGLPYPGGPEISKLAQTARSSKMESVVKLPRPMIDSGDFDFSFSGLKTAVLRAVEGKTLSDTEKMSMAREIEDAIVDVLVAKTKRAVRTHGAQTVIVGGGVSANTHLRTQLTDALKDENIALFFPEPKLATDNARMIALAGYFHALNKEFADPAQLTAKGNLKLV